VPQHRRMSSIEPEAEESSDRTFQSVLQPGHKKIPQEKTGSREANKTENFAPEMLFRLSSSNAEQNPDKKTKHKGCFRVFRQPP